MKALRRVPAVFGFEWRRALTIPRLSWMLALAAFAPVLLMLVRSAAGSPPPPIVAAVFVYVLAPGVVCMMSVFLLATPAISAELEGRSWVYLAVRPYGLLAVLLGKYLVAVTWALPVGLTSAILSSVVMADTELPRMVAVQSGLAALSCIAYAAVFLLIGVLAPKRAMVFGVVYAVGVEVGAAFIPAAVNLLTIQHRLRCLLVLGMRMDEGVAERNPVFLSYFGDETATWHIFILLTMTASYLIAAALILHFREFTAAAETDT